MSVEQMREAIAAIYPFDKWRNKVAKMHERQVIAVYHKFLDTGRFEKDAPRRTQYTMEPVNMKNEAEQLSFL